MVIIIMIIFNRIIMIVFNNNGRYNGFCLRSYNNDDYNITNIETNDDNNNNSNNNNNLIIILMTMIIPS
jgi:hypothetical protein